MILWTAAALQILFCCIIKPLSVKYIKDDIPDESHKIKDSSNRNGMPAKAVHGSQHEKNQN